MSFLRVYIGGCTSELSWVKGQARGISLYTLDPGTGQLSKRSEMICDNPSFLALHPSGKFLFATHEATQWEVSPEGAISAFAIAEDGTLSALNRQPAWGEAPCFVSVESTGKFIMTANYVGGNFVLYPIGVDGHLAEASHQARQSGSRSDSVQQPLPHAHSIVAVPGGRYALACDLGLDKIFVYELDLKNGKLLLHAEAVVPSDSGPRHLAVHPNQFYVYAINELGGTISAFAWDDAAGQLRELQTISTLPADYTAQKWCADIHVHPNGKFVYGTNRGHDSLVMYEIDQTSGRLTLIGHTSTQGRTPRSFALTPTGDLLLVANQDSNTIVVFRVDGDTGQLTYLATNEVPTPTCLKFA